MSRTIERVQWDAGPLPAGPGTAGARTRVVLGIEDVGFHQEVLDWLDRDYRVDVVVPAIANTGAYTLQVKANGVLANVVTINVTGTSVGTTPTLNSGATVNGASFALPSAAKGPSMAMPP